MTFRLVNEFMIPDTRGRTTCPVGCFPGGGYSING